MAGIRIDALPSLPNLEQDVSSGHEFPAMLDGVTSKISLAQVFTLMNALGLPTNDEVILLVAAALEENVAQTDNIADGAVVEAKLGNFAVTEDKIASDAVTEGKILDDAVTTAKIRDANVTNAKIANRAAVSVMGRSANSAGAVADIAAAANDRILARVSNAISFVQLTIGMFPDNLVTFAKLATAAIADSAEAIAGTATNLLMTPAATADAIGSRTREQLTANRTYYVRTDGNDANTGLANTSGAAFKTLQRAWDKLNQIDLNSFSATIKVADGTYTDKLVANVLPIGGPVTIEGNVATPANCIISVTGNHALAFYCGNTTELKGFRLQTTGSGSCLVAGDNTRINVGNMEFGATAGNHIQTQNFANITFVDNYRIVGDAASRHISASGGSVVVLNTAVVSITGTRNIPILIYCDRQSLLTAQASTWPASGVTGQRYFVQTNGIVISGGGANFFPGTSAGTTATQGQYL